MSELLNCPFCGGEAHTMATSGIRAPWVEVMLDGIGCTVVCESCGATIPSSISEAHAIRFWNTRAKPTWRELRGIDMDYVRDLIERHSDSTGGNSCNFHNGAYAAIAEELNARAERTCHYVDDDGLMGTCSLCGEPMGEAHRFCPWCGAKVVKESD